MLDLLSEQERRSLLRTGIRRRFARGEVVLHEGDPGDSLHIVIQGAFIARSSSTLGALIAVNVAGVGDVFGKASSSRPAPAARPPSSPMGGAPRS